MKPHVPVSHQIVYKANQKECKSNFETHELSRNVSVGHGCHAHMTKSHNSCKLCNIGKSSLYVMLVTVYGYEQNPSRSCVHKECELYGHKYRNRANLNAHPQFCRA